MTVPLAWRRVAPIPVVVVVLAPAYAMTLAGNRLDAAYIMLVLIVAVTAVGSYTATRRQAAAGLALALFLLAALFSLEGAAGDGESNPIGDLIFVAGIVGGFGLLAVLLRERSERTGELEQRAERLEREREERAHAAVAEERARIARELHDVVAHSISVIAVQTGSMRRRLRNERPAEARELEQTEQTARQALADMRRMLGLLRADDDGLALAPQPGIGDVEHLVDQVRGTGLDIELEVDGDRRPLPPGVDLAAYRIVQEALTNVIKHAGPAHALVGVHYNDRQLELEVIDDGSGPSVEQNGGGHGLIGMRERVALYGGSLDAGPGSERGFAVRARLPIAGA
jgi:signal transduction histidine kinase